ncbi:Bacteroides conjugative transposon TraK protein [Pedobacter suwonensis]|uniref:Bacteroides conjugative transposon TraK protein n=1 Tax=Pedobacter suwonensis TaxID=332999 RepID=A0A1I0TXH7_9SPHI|nr:conjugative transposon protein TraK [Pedobacter suwonensis]SFA56484.1 Bacteroides conjugative transposon TraK protein [Pedobacter suwonensis]
MFRQLNNIETAFKHVRLFSFVLIGACMAICCFVVYESYRMVSKTGERIYLLSSGKALSALATDRRDNIEVEARDHIRSFHYFFFTLDPDDKVIENNLKQALYLADNTAARQYEDLKENGYYNSVISGNISQQLAMDSIRLDMSSYPYYFRYYGTQRIIRPTAILTRSLLTEGYLRNVSRSDNNAHGFLIERWRILENNDKDIQKRQ